jgi:hypothetical protein
MPVLLANAGVPMLFVQWVGMALALLPIVAIEAVAYRVATRRSIGRSLRISVLANLASTLVGVPLAWFASLVMQIALSGIIHHDSFDGRGPSVVHEAVLRAAWLWPLGGHLKWMMRVSFMVLLLPAFIVSVIIEGYVARTQLEDLPGPTLWAVVLRANLLSYVLLLAYCVWQFIVEYPSGTSVAG